MSTFERVRRNIERDMEMTKVHTAASWAAIMLRNTSRLTNGIEQKKFLEWMTNPFDENVNP